MYLISDTNISQIHDVLIPLFNSYIQYCWLCSYAFRRFEVKCLKYFDQNINMMNAY